MKVVSPQGCDLVDPFHCQKSIIIHVEVSPLELTKNCKSIFTVFSACPACVILIMAFLVRNVNIVQAYILVLMLF